MSSLSLIGTLEVLITHVFIITKWSIVPRSIYYFMLTTSPLHLKICWQFRSWSHNLAVNLRWRTWEPLKWLWSWRSSGIESRRIFFTVKRNTFRKCLIILGWHLQNQYVLLWQRPFFNLKSILFVKQVASIT